jgi:hypothetical protein
MRSRDDLLLNTRVHWITPLMKMTPVGASSNIPFVHMHDSHGMTLPVSPLRHVPHLPLPEVGALNLWLQLEADALLHNRLDTHLLVNPLILPDPHLSPHKVTTSTLR